MLEEFQSIEKKLRELETQEEYLSRCLPQEKLQEITAFACNSDNFSEEELETLKSIEKALDQRLSRELNNILDPKKTEKTRKQLKDIHHWIPVR